MRRPKLTFSVNPNPLDKLMAQARRQVKKKVRYKMNLGTNEDFINFLKTKGIDLLNRKERED